MKIAEMVKCFFFKKHKTCYTCEERFKCLTHRWTDADKATVIHSIPHCILRVPNNEEGRLFYDHLKKYLNKERYRLERYGRAKNRKERGGNQSSTPIDTCDYFGVYLRDKYEV